MTEGWGCGSSGRTSDLGMTQKIKHKRKTRKIGFHQIEKL
jgi:hypothetical protein